MSDLVTKVVVLDFWSDNNRGDAAMQVGLLRLLRRHLPASTITVVAAYGANQYPAFLEEFDETAAEADAIVGGLRSTFTPLGPSRLKNAVVRKAANLAAVPLGLILLPLWIAAVRLRKLDRLVPPSHRATVEVIRSADLVIWNGRNFRCDSARREVYEIWNLLYNPLVALGAGKRIACVGASIWPIRRASSRWLLRRVIGRTAFTSLREPESFARAQALLGDTNAKLALLPDLSLVVLPPARERDLQPLPTDHRWPRRIGLTVVDWKGSGPEARSAYLSAITELVRRMAGRGVEVRVIRQVSYENEPTSRVDQELAMAGPLVEFRTQASTIEALTDEYAEVDLLVATRMHSAIFALAAGTPIVTIPYDSGGKWGILDMFGAADVSVSFRGVTCDAIEERITEVWARRNNMVIDVQNRLEELRPRLEEHLSMAMDAIGSARRLR